LSAPHERTGSKQLIARLAERFVRPLTIDRIRALVSPAIEEARVGGEAPKFEMLQHDTDCLTREPTGVGLDVPAWLVALEEEVEDALHADDHGCPEHALTNVIPPLLLSFEDAKKQLEEWSSRQTS